MQENIKSPKLQHRSASHDNESRPTVVNNEPNIAELVNFDAPDSDSEKSRSRRSLVRLKILKRSRKRYTLSQDSTRQPRIKNPEIHRVSETKFINPLRLHPPGYVPPLNMQFGPVWPSSGRQPGEPGYGYQPDGTPLGSDYILHMRGWLNTAGSSRDRTVISTRGGRDLMIEELRAGGWEGTEEMAERIVTQTTLNDQRPVDMNDVMVQNKLCEANELERTRKVNSEFSLDDVTLNQQSYGEDREDILHRFQTELL